MSGASDYFGKAGLNWMAGALAMPALPSVWMALMTAVDTDAGTGGTEVSGGSYARVQVAGTATVNGTTANGNPTLHFAATPAWIVAGMAIYDVTTAASIPAATTVLSTTGTTVTMSANAAGGGVGATDVIAFSAFSAPTSSQPLSMTTGAAIAFATSTVSWGTVIAWELRDAVTTGNLLTWDFLGNYAWLPATVSTASPGVITTKAHGYSAADIVIWSNEYGGTSPSFSQSTFAGYVPLAVVSPAADTFTVTNGGTAVNTSSTGDGAVRKITQLGIGSGVSPSFSAGTLTISLA